MAQIRWRVVANFEGCEHDNAVFERGIEAAIKALPTDGRKEPPPEVQSDDGDFYALLLNTGEIHRVFFFPIVDESTVPGC